MIKKIIILLTVQLIFLVPSNACEFSIEKLNKAPESNKLMLAVVPVNNFRKSSKKIICLGFKNISKDSIFIDQNWKLYQKYPGEYSPELHILTKNNFPTNTLLIEMVGLGLFDLEKKTIPIERLAEVKPNDIRYFEYLLPKEFVYPKFNSDGSWSEYLHFTLPKILELESHFKLVYENKNTQIENDWEGNKYIKIWTGKVESTIFFLPK